MALRLFPEVQQLNCSACASPTNHNAQRSRERTPIPAAMARQPSGLHWEAVHKVDGRREEGAVAVLSRGN